MIHTQEIFLRLLLFTESNKSSSSFWSSSLLSSIPKNLLYKKTCASTARYALRFNSARLACWSTPSLFRLWNQLRGAQQKAAPCPRIMGFSPQSGVVRTRDVFREGLRVLASEARARANEREQVRGSQFTRTKQQVQLQDMRTYNKYVFS